MDTPKVTRYDSRTASMNQTTPALEPYELPCGCFLRREAWGWDQLSCEAHTAAAVAFLLDESFDWQSR